VQAEKSETSGAGEIAAAQLSAPGAGHAAIEQSPPEPPMLPTFAPPVPLGPVPLPPQLATSGAARPTPTTKTTKHRATKFFIARYPFAQTRRD
jgi:hypothetical protein